MVVVDLWESVVVTLYYLYLCFIRDGWDIYEEHWRGSNCNHREREKEICVLFSRVLLLFCWIKEEQWWSIYNREFYGCVIVNIKTPIKWQARVLGTHVWHSVYDESSIELSWILSMKRDFCMKIVWWKFICSISLLFLWVSLMWASHLHLSCIKEDYKVHNRSCINSINALVNLMMKHL